MQLHNTIFLDIDGVLWTHEGVLQEVNESIRLVGKDCISLRMNVLDPICVARFRKLTNEINAQIVISSSWRKHHSLEWIRGFFSAHSIYTIVDMIGDELYQSRASAVLEFIKRNNITNFVVIDDEPIGHEFIGSSLEPHLIKTDFNSGFQLEHIEIAKNILGIKDAKTQTQTQTQTI